MLDSGLLGGAPGRWIEMERGGNQSLKGESVYDSPPLQACS